MKLCALVENIPQALPGIIKEIRHKFITGTTSQGIHEKCPDSSPCKLPNYSPSKTVPTDPKTIMELEKKLLDMYIYKCAEAVCYKINHTTNLN